MRGLTYIVGIPTSFLTQAPSSQLVAQAKYIPTTADYPSALELKKNGDAPWENVFQPEFQTNTPVHPNHKNEDKQFKNLIHPPCIYYTNSTPNNTT